MNQKNLPQYLLMDFDRTLTSLYENEQLLYGLSHSISALYSYFLTVPESQEERDGYMVWHELHQRAVCELSEADANHVNRAAESMVTDFELNIMKRTPLFPGAAETLQKLAHQGVKLGVISSNHKSVLEYAFQTAGIESLFCCMEGRPVPFEPSLIKPSPYPIQHALKTLQISHEDVWYVGDDIFDMQAAQGAGVTAVGAATGKYTKEELLAAGADFCLDSFTELGEWTCC